MILQALTKLYEDLAERGEIARPGWGPVKISYALCIDETGKLTQVIPQTEEQVVGKKTVLRPRSIELPAAVKRSSRIAANFLWDNAAYLLGIDSKGKPERARQCFEECQRQHHQILDSIDTPTAKAILAFFDGWEPQSAAEHPALKDCMEELQKGGNLVIRVSGTFAQTDSEIRSAWQAYYDDAVGEKQQCLVTGRENVISPTHPSISGVRDAQSSGAAIVSFNAPAFCSYGKEQNYNAPVGKYAAFAYTSALNHLLADREAVQHIGDTTVVCWADGAEPQYQGFSMAALFGGNPPEGLTNGSLHAAVKRLADGLPCDELNLDPNRPFYILGLAPNAARLSVRFFLRDTFGNLMKNINTHHERMEIVHAPNDYPTLPLWAMLRETVNMNSRDKSPSPVMAGAAARAIFTGTLYPASMLEATMLRIRAERNITRGRASIIKAYYLKNENPQVPKEVLQVSLNEQSTNIPYTLGRLFSVYEALQEKANPGINATIKDKYFNAAASTPATVFPILNNLAQKHLRKLENGQQVYFNRLIGQIKNILPEELPTRLTLPEQGSFDIGYYHQAQKRYEKKEEQ